MVPFPDIEIFLPFLKGELFAGFSGGADSTAVLLAVRQYCRRCLTAVHFAHNLRGEESEREAREAEQFCRKRRIPFLRIDLAIPEDGNLEEAAREARLAEWQKLTAGKNAAVILGHHADDAVETLLLRLARGSNVSGLAALRPVSVVGGVTFLRPLLGWRRSEIEQFLREQGVERWAEDSSNGNDRFIRNALRNRLLPEFYAKVPGSETGLLRALGPLREDAEYLESEGARHFSEIAGETQTLSAFWRKMHPAMLVRVFRLWLTGYYGHDVVPNRALAARFREEIARQTQQTRYMPLPEGGVLCFRGTESVGFHTPSAPSPEALAWRWRGTPAIRWGDFVCRAVPVEKLSHPTPEEAFFDADELPEELFIDRRREGDVLLPFGRKGEVGLKKLRVDKGLPAGFPNPVLRAEDGIILWAPGIRHSNHAKVTANTRHIILFRLESGR